MLLSTILAGVFGALSLVSIMVNIAFGCANTNLRKENAELQVADDLVFDFVPFQ